jgi:hypothetical protein
MSKRHAWTLALAGLLGGLWPAAGQVPADPQARVFVPGGGDQPAVRLTPGQRFVLSNGEMMLIDPKAVNGAGNGHGAGGVNGNGGNGREREHIKDNSFFIEEAYNQEPGVVQHIFNGVGFWDWDNGRTREFAYLFTMELPLGSEMHQFSFTLPFVTFFAEPDGGLPEEQGGWSDVALNYRYQLLKEDEGTPAIAPRISVILPTGDEGRGLGTGEVGYEFLLPISKELDPFAFHINAGFAVTPDVSVPLGNGQTSPGRDLRSCFLGASAIWLATYDFNVLLEFFTVWDEGLDETGRRDRTTEVVISPGVRYALFTGEEVQWVIGGAVPVGLSKDAPDIGMFLYMSVEHNFLKNAE